MNRRHFFQGLLGGMATPLLPVDTEAAEFSPDQPYGGWALHWTGWLVAPYQSILYGAWTAHHPDGRRYYTTTTHGRTLAYTPGAMFDYTQDTTHGWPFLEVGTPDELLEVQALATLVRLKLFLRGQPA